MTKANKTVLVGFAAIALALAGSAPALAEHEEGHEADEGGSGGNAHADLGIFVGSMTFDNVVDSDNGPVFGIRAGYDWDHHWGVEFVAGWEQANMESTSHRNRDHTLAALSLQYSFRYDGDQVVVPYVAAGIGGWQEDTDGGAQQNEFLAHGAVGLRFRASKHIALMIDVREWFVPWYNPYRGKNVDANNESAQFHFAYRF